MKNILKYILTFFFLFACIAVYPRSYSFRGLSLTEGLSDLVVNAIYKDSLGYVWIGTGNSLERFDGIHIKHYLIVGDDEKLKRVNVITEMPDNQIWMGNGMGLWRLNEEKNDLEPIARETINHGVHSLLHDGKGTLYIGTEAGLFIYRKGNMNKNILIIICLLILSGLTGLYSQDTGDVQVKSGYVKVPEGSLYYEEAGTGEPLIFIHGHSLDRRMWNEQFFKFAKHYRAIRYDLRGYGISSKQTEDFQFTHAEDLVALMDALHIRKAHIVGLSLGGFVGADMLGCFPDRMLSAFLASGNIRKSKGPSEPMTKEEAAKRDEEIAALEKKGVDVMKKEWFEGLMQSGGTRKERMRVPLWEMIDDWDAWQPLHKEVRVIIGLDAYAKLKENHPQVPTLIVEGRSPGNRYSDHPEILDYLPNGKLKVLDDCGHMMNMEQPEAFNEALEEFLNDLE